METKDIACSVCSKTIAATIMTKIEAIEWRKKYGLPCDNVFVQTDGQSLPNIYCADCRAKLTKELVDNHKPLDRTLAEILLKEAAEMMDNEDFQRGYIIGVELGQRLAIADRLGGAKRDG